MLDGNEKILCAVPSKDIISLYQNLNYHQADTIEGSLVLSEKYTSILNNVRYFAISDRESNHNFYLYRKTLVQVQNHEIAINGQGAFWDEMQGAYIKDRRPNQVTPADTIKLILGYSRWNVDYVDQMLEEESLRRDMNFYYVSLLDALNTVYQTWQVDIEPYINIEGHQITRRYVKLYQQQGGNNGRRFVYGDNALTVTQQANEGSIFTALVGRGAGVEETDASGNLTGGYSRKINFADIEWSKANGDPCDKPKGQEYVEWKESTELYGYSDGKPRIGIVNFDNEKDPAQLLKETWARLQQVGVPLVQFQATVGDVGYLNLGETVTIVRYDLNIKYQTRVTGIKWNRCDEAKSQITIGVKAIQSTADKIAGLQQSVAQANVNADEAKSTANHAIIDGMGAVVNYGPNEPTNPKEGDIWYDVQPDGTVVLKQYQNGQWVILIDDTTGQQIKNKVEAQQKELDKAVQDANAASAKADGLVAQVGDANTNAQKALATAQQNQADLAQAKNDLENTKNQLTNVQSDLTGTKSSLAGAISNISQAQEDLKNTEQSLQGVKSSLANDEKNLSDLTKQAQTQGQTIVDIQKIQSGLSADVADVKGNVSSLQDTANGLQATVKDNQGNISKLQDTANSLQSSITDNKNNIASIKQTAGSIQSTVASMQNAGENLIVNSDFEQGGYHWNLNGWQISNDDEFRNHKIISKTQSGLDSANYNEFSATDLIPVQKGQTISIGVWVKASNVDSLGDGNWGATFGVNWYADNKSGRNHWSDYRTKADYGNHDWRFLKMEGLQPPADSNFARAHFFLTQNGTAQFALPIMAYGDKLPAWSPSPLDSATATDMSSVEQTVNGLKSTVQSNKGDISTLKQTASGLESDVQNNKNSISTIKQSADKVQSIVSNMKVGGTNLLPETQNYTGYIRWGGTEIIDDYSYNDYQFKPQTKIIHLYQTNGNHSLDNAMPTPDNKPVHIIQGKQYTFSAYVWHYGDTGQANELVTLYANNGNSTLELGTVTTTLTNQAILYHFTFTATQAGDYTRFRVVHRNNCDMVNGSMFIAEMKLEEGNVATDWSPSPYDMASQDDLSSVEQTVSGLTSTVQSHSGQISQVKQTADSLSSKIADVDGNISQLKQTSDSLTSQIGNANNDISSLKQRADSMESNISDNENNISDLRQTANSLQSNIQSKADISQVTQLSNTFQTVVQNIGPFYPDGDFSDTDLSKYYDPWDTCTSLDNFSVVTNNSDWGYYLQIYTPQGTINKMITKEYLPINANYPITFKGKSLLSYDGELKGKFQVYYHFYDSNKNQVGSLYVDWYKYDNNNVWQDFSSTLTPPSGAVYLRIETLLDNSEGSGTYWGALDNLSIENGEATIASKISQMADDINLRVQKGDLLSQINIQAGSTLIQSKKLFLDASSVVFSGNAFIPSAAITDLSADKITAGTLNAGNVNIINLDVNKLVGNTTEFVRSGWTNAYGSHVQIDGGGMTVNYGNWYTRFDGNGMTFKDGGDNLGGFTRIGMTGAPDWYNGLAFNAGGDAEFLSIGAQDYGNDNQNPVPAKLLWMRSFDDKNRYGYQPGWNFCDTVWADDLKLNHIGTSSYRLDLVALSMNGETAFGLQSGNGYGFWWGANGGLGIYGGGKYVNFTHTKFINDIQMGQGGSINWSSL